MKPLTAALIAGGVAFALILARRSSAPASPATSVALRELGAFLDTPASPGSLLAEVDSVAVRALNWLGGIDRRAVVGDVIDPYRRQEGEGDRITFAQIPPAFPYDWGAGEGW